MRNSITVLEWSLLGVCGGWTNLIKVRNLKMKIKQEKRIPGETMMTTTILHTKVDDDDDDDDDHYKPLHTKVLILLFIARVVVAYGAGSLIIPIINKMK